MLTYSLEEPQGILIVNARGKLGKNDFARLTQAATDYLATHRQLKGVLLRAQAFPDWESMAGLATHLEFARAHRNRVKRVALVSDSAAAGVVASLLGHLSTAIVRHFSHADAAQALAWLTSR